MAGHNKWSKIKRLKEVLDSKKGKVFTKLLKEITVAARIGGGSPDTNARLRQAIVAARQASVPRDNIERAVKKGTGEVEADAIEETLYEGYGPGGVAILVEGATDNRNRTVADLRNIFRSAGGSLAEAGSVAWMFDRVGQIFLDKAKYPEDIVTDLALEAGAQDVTTHGDIVEVITGPTDLFQVKEVFDKKGVEAISSGFAYVAKNPMSIDQDISEKFQKLVDDLEDHDDVQRTHANTDF
jgi:YebC/PmpR family DNA-binding regulatory protein